MAEENETTTEQTTPSTTDTPTGQSPTSEPKPDAGVLLTDDNEATSPTSWIETLPEDLRANEKLVGFKSVEELAKAYADAKLAPTIPDASEYKVPEDFPVKDIGKWAAEAGYTQQQLDNMLELSATVEKTQMEVIEGAYQKGLEHLFTEWGPQKDSNIKYAKQVITHFDKSGELKSLLNSTRAGNHPSVVKFFAELGRQVFSEDGFVRPGSNTSSQKRSAADVIFDAS